MIQVVNIISLKEFRLNTTKYINKVKKGESFTVLRKNQPVFNIAMPRLYDLSSVPIATDEDMDDLKKSKTVLSFKKEGGIPMREFYKIMEDFEKREEKDKVKVK